MAALDNIRRDPAVFNTAAKVDGIVWTDRDRDRLQDIDEGEVVAARPFIERQADWERLSDAARLERVRGAVIAVNEDLPKALRMGPENYRQVKAALQDLNELSQVMTFHLRHPDSEPEATLLEDNYDHLTLLIDANRAGTRGPQPAEKKAQLGYLFRTGAITMAKSSTGKPALHEDIRSVMAALATLRSELEGIMREGSRDRAEAFLATRDAIPREWDTEMVPYLKDLNGSQGPGRFTKLFVILARRPAPTRATQPTPAPARPTSGCGCALGARP